MKLSDFWKGEPRSPGEEPLVRALKEQVEVAKRELQAAEQYFQAVSEPELIDHAIFAVEAARRKYHYLFRRLRESYGLPVGQEGVKEWT
jgi:hypothetical protein